MKLLLLYSIQHGTVRVPSTLNPTDAVISCLAVWTLDQQVTWMGAHATNIWSIEVEYNQNINFN